MTDPQGSGAAPPARLEPHEVARLSRRGEAVLVCAYEGAVAFRKWPLEGALSLAELEAALDGIEPGTDLVFYCRCPEERTAAARAAEFRTRGWSAAVLAGGVRAWQEAGLPMARSGRR